MINMVGGFRLLNISIIIAKLIYKKKNEKKTAVIKTMPIIAIYVRVYCYAKVADLH